MSKARTLGSIVKSIRTERGWTLAEMSRASGIPLSTLSKIEHDKLTLTYDKLQQFSRDLDIPLSELFAESRARSAVVTARRSIATLDNAITIKTPNYVYHYLCPDLRQRRMLPIVVEITAKTLADFGDLVRHGGEEFVTVLEGAVVFHSEFYSPITLHVGEGIYIDSSMGHAYLVAEGYDRATMMSVCASDDENLQESLIAEAESRGAVVEPGRQRRRAHKKSAA
jgi:transcriptional regulator with XRE-family HTH domain